MLASANASAAPEGALDILFSASDRLARDADDRSGRDDLRAMVERLDPASPPYGVAVNAWAKAVEAGRQLADLVDDDASTSSDIIGAAQALRTLVRQYVA